MKEEWRNVVGYEGFYEVSSFGNVRSLDRRIRNGRGFMTKTGTILKPYAGNGKLPYSQVSLCVKCKNSTKTIHRLVANAFIDNPDRKPQVNHIDENKTNNNVNNLEWVTAKENINHGTCIERISKSNCNSKYSRKVAQYTDSGELVKIWPSTSEAIKNGYNGSCISACCLRACRPGKGTRKYHKGFLWKYLSKEESDLPRTAIEEKIKGSKRMLKVMEIVKPHKDI